MVMYKTESKSDHFLLLKNVQRLLLFLEGKE